LNAAAACGRRAAALYAPCHQKPTGAFFSSASVSLSPRRWPLLDPAVLRWKVLEALGR